MPRPSTVVTALLVVGVGAGGCEPPRQAFEPPPCGVVTQGIVLISPSISIGLPLELGGAQCTPGAACDDEFANECRGSIQTTAGAAHDFVIQIENASPVRLALDSVSLDGDCIAWSFAGAVPFDVEADTFQTVGLHLEPTEAGTCADVLHITSNAGNVNAEDRTVSVALSAVVTES
jgi:hypothetical protein